MFLSSIHGKKNIFSFKKNQILQVIATKNDQDKTTEILAAVGAGMVPATMAFLMPMMLGRKKRSLDQLTSSHIQRFHQPPDIHIIQPM